MGAHARFAGEATAKPGLPLQLSVLQRLGPFELLLGFVPKQLGNQLLAELLQVSKGMFGAATKCRYGNGALLMLLVFLRKQLSSQLLITLLQVSRGVLHFPTIATVETVLLLLPGFLHKHLGSQLLATLLQVSGMAKVTTLSMACSGHLFGFLPR